MQHFRCEKIDFGISHLRKGHLMFPLGILTSGKNGRSWVHKTAAITIASQSALCLFQTSCFHMMPAMIKRSISNNGGEDESLCCKSRFPVGPSLFLPYIHCAHGAELSKYLQLTLLWQKSIIPSGTISLFCY